MEQKDSKIKEKIRPLGNRRVKRQGKITTAGERQVKITKIRKKISENNKELLGLQGNMKIQLVK